MKYSIQLRLEEAVLKKARHPDERKYFKLAIITGILVGFIYLLLIIASWGGFILMGLLTALFIWIVMQLKIVELIGNSVQVSEDSFPEIYAIYKVLKTEMKIYQEVPIFIIQDGDVNAYFTKFLNRRFIILNSSLVEGMKDGEVELSEIEWVIGRFLGALKAKHFRIQIVRFIIDQAQDLMIFNFLLKPYERKLQLTGDNIGLLANRNLNNALNALNKFNLGNGLAQDIKIEAIINQVIAINRKPVFTFLSKAYSSHPFLVYRYLNLIGFAKKEFPDQFRAYVSQLSPEYRRKLQQVLVHY